MVAALKRFLAGPLPVFAVFLLLIASLAVMAAATQNSTHFHDWQWWTAGFNILLGLLLLGLIGISLSRLVRRLRRRETGSRLSLRITVMFASFTLIPPAMVFGFSVWLISSGIDSWFDVGVDDTLHNAMDLSRSAIDMQMRQRHAQLKDLLLSPPDTDDPEAAIFRVHDLVTRTGALEAVLLDAGNTILALHGEGPSIVPDLPDEAQLQLLQESGIYMAQETHPEHGSIIRILLRVPSLGHDRTLTLQALYPLSEHMLRLTGSVEEASGTYQRLLDLREPLKFNLMLVMSLALLLGLLFAIWAALYSAQRILSPVPELARGIEAVTQGEYSQRLPSGRSDELGQLVDAYNDMIRRLANARFVAETRRLTIQQQHAYLHTILEHLSSGVISISSEGKLMTANHAAGTILDVDLEQHYRQPIAELQRKHPELQPLWDLMEQQFRGAIGLDRQLRLDGESKVLHCHGAQLPGNVGHVVVFEDITHLQQAQRQAAWGEVARRMAHEIKNPLTPIRLSTERLQRRLQEQLNDEDAELLRHATRTIVRQVESMKTMINEFSDYSNTRFTPERIDLNSLAEEVLDMYQDYRPEVAIHRRLSAEPAALLADPNRLRQLLHNLLKNALEAQAEQARGSITLATTVSPDAVTLAVQDAGPGFAPEILARACEPYITTKPDGNGLGLAVVQRIAEDHRGKIRVYNDPEGGGCVEVRFAARAGSG